MPVAVFKTIDELSVAVADWMVKEIASVLQQQDRFTLALSGGSTPKKLHHLLASSPYKEKIDWAKIHIFWGDDRFVPFNDERNNAKMAFDTLLNFVDVPPDQIHVMKTENISPEASAQDYEMILHNYFDHTPHTFDLIILGMGDDGHTLSLFPGMPVVHEEKAWATAFYLPAQDMYRVTVTKTVANRSSRVAFLTTGSNKADALYHVLKGAYEPDKYPSQVIKPTGGEPYWFVDESAAAKIN